MSEYQKGFDDAIDKVLYYLDEEINLHEASVKCNNGDTRRLRKWRMQRQAGRDSLFMFKQLVIGLFKTIAVESEKHE
jgi:hypothetical protein